MGRLLAAHLRIFHVEVFLCENAYVCIHVYIYIYNCICIYIYIYTIYTYTCICVCICISNSSISIIMLIVISIYKLLLCTIIIHCTSGQPEARLFTFLAVSMMCLYVLCIHTCVCVHMCIYMYIYIYI